MTLDNGTTLGGFRIVGGIRGGAFSEVYKAVRIDDPTAFAALKVHLPNEKTTPRDFCREIENARLVHRIIRRARRRSTRRTRSRSVRGSR